MKTCNKCNDINWSFWTSSTTGKTKKYCKTCRKKRALEYTKRQSNAFGSHTKKQWLEKLAQFDKCPMCSRVWDSIPIRPDKRYKFVWTKDHIIPLHKDGTDEIENIQPLCYQCNFGKR